MTSPFIDNDDLTAHPHLYPNHDSFPGLQFVGHIKPSSVRLMANGELEMKVLIKREFVERSWKLKNAYRIPLTFDIQPWKVYEEAREQANG